jgi:prepilin-type N-terminal cleavage/methylation domain-containing protein
MIFSQISGEKMKKIRGLTLIEVLIATVVLVVALLSTLGLLSHSLSLPQGNKDSTIALHEAEAMMEQICADDYLTIRQRYATVAQTPFTIANLTGMGTVYANELPGAINGLMRVKVVVCYRHKNRIIGEDADLDGILDTGEDTILTNGELDSPCQLETVIVNKEF